MEQLITVISNLPTIQFIILVIAIVFVIMFANISNKILDIKHKKTGELIDFTRGVLRRIHSDACSNARSIIETHESLSCSSTCGSNVKEVQNRFFHLISERIFMSEIKGMFRTSFMVNGFHDLSDLEYEKWVWNKAKYLREEAFSRMLMYINFYPTLEGRLGSKFTEQQAYEYCKEIYDRAKQIKIETKNEIRAIFMFWK